MDSKTDSFITIIIIVVIFVLLLSLFTRSDNTQKEYDELEEKYYDLESSYENYKEKIWNNEDDFATVWCFFENENDITFEEAKDAFMRIDSNIMKVNP